MKSKINPNELLTIGNEIVQNAECVDIKFGKEYKSTALKFQFQYRSLLNCILMNNHNINLSSVKFRVVVLSIAASFELNMNSKAT